MTNSTRLIAMAAEEYKDDKGEKQTRWYEIGIAWPTKSGEGYNVKLAAGITCSQFSLFPPKAKEPKAPTA